MSQVTIFKIAFAVSIVVMLILLTIEGGQNTVVV